MHSMQQKHLVVTVTMVEIDFHATNWLLYGCSHHIANVSGQHLPCSTHHYTIIKGMPLFASHSHASLS